MAVNELQELSQLEHWSVSSVGWEKCSERKYNFADNAKAELLAETEPAPVFFFPEILVQSPDPENLASSKMEVSEDNFNKCIPRVVYYTGLVL